MANEYMQYLEQMIPEMISEELSSWDLSSKDIKRAHKLASRFLKLD